jgi:hypothetical protein
MPPTERFLPVFGIDGSSTFFLELRRQLEGGGDNVVFRFSPGAASVWPAFFRSALCVGLFQVFIPLLCGLQAILCARALLLRALPDGRTIITCREAVWKGARFGDAILLFQLFASLVQGVLFAWVGLYSRAVPFAAAQSPFFIPELLNFSSSYAMSALFLSLLSKGETATRAAFSGALNKALFAAVLILSVTGLIIGLLSSAFLVSTTLMVYICVPCVLVCGIIIIVPLASRARRAASAINASTKIVAPTSPRAAARTAGAADAAEKQARAFKGFVRASVLLIVSELLSVFFAKALALTSYLYSPAGALYLCLLADAKT